MNFALLGDHPDGLDMARALVESGRYRLRSYAGSVIGAEYLRRWQLDFGLEGDVEDIFADPAIALVIVADRLDNRFGLVRRALQSEKHVLCVHPLSSSPDAAYEAALLQKEKGCALFPLLPEVGHPAFEHVAKLIAQDRARHGKEKDVTALPHLIQMERHDTESVFYDVRSQAGVWAVGAETKPGCPGWEVLRYLAGEIVEVSAFSQWVEVMPHEPLVLTGVFERGGMFQTTLIPHQAESNWRLTVYLHRDQAHLVFPEGWPGPARLTWRDENGEMREESWENWNPWPWLVTAFENMLAVTEQRVSSFGDSAERDGRTAEPCEDTFHGSAVERGDSTSITRATPSRQGESGDNSEAIVAAPRKGNVWENGRLVSWQDEIRCLELDDAAWRSVERRRSSTLEYQEAVEQASVKGTMTLMGCGLLWLSLLLLILSIWVPFMGYLIIPMFAVFLVLQLLLWLVFPPQQPKAAQSQKESSGQQGPTANPS